MEYALLIGVVAFLAIMGIYGYMRGFIKVVLSAVAMLVTIVLAVVLTIPVSSIIKGTPIGESVRESVEEIVADAEIVDVDSISNLELPKSLLNPIVEGASEAENELNEYVADTLTNIIINSGTFLVLIIVIYIILRIVIAVLNIMSKLPIINGINKAAGAALGVVYGLVYVWIACLILSACSSEQWAINAFAQINDNSFLQFIYNNNMVIWAVTKLI